jgi:hypothetical protein
LDGTCPSGAISAWVDEGIAPLVPALNELPDVLTLGQL